MASSSKENVENAKKTSNEKPVLPNSNIKNKRENRVMQKRLVLLFGKILFFVLVVYVVFGVVFGVTRMDGNNMYPNIKNGDLLIYYRLENNYNNGDAVVVRQDGNDVVYRIVALPGQKIDVDEYGKVTIDGQPSTVESFYETKKDEESVIPYPYTVPENSYFVMNDYRKDTNDSRKFAQISRDLIKGRLITKIQIRDL